LEFDSDGVELKSLKEYVVGETYRQTGSDRNLINAVNQVYGNFADHIIQDGYVDGEDDNT
jgi:hypothetical protein